MFLSVARLINNGRLCRVTTKSVSDFVCDRNGLTYWLTYCSGQDEGSQQQQHAGRCRVQCCHRKHIVSRADATVAVDTEVGQQGLQCK